MFIQLALGSVRLGATDLNSDPVGGELLDDGGDERDVAGKTRRRRPLQNEPDGKNAESRFRAFLWLLTLTLQSLWCYSRARARASASASAIDSYSARARATTIASASDDESAVLGT